MSIPPLAAYPLLALTMALAPQAPDPDRLYGRVTTVSGEVLEGFIRWDQNEGSRFDVLNANKEIPDRNAEEGQALRGQHYEHCEPGLHIRWGHFAWHDGCGPSGSAQANIRFGHIERLEVMNSRQALITLRSGERREFRANSTDLGRSNRGIVVDDATRGTVELGWSDIRTIDFLPATARPSVFGRRLYGTLVTRDGLEFTGYVTWDMDEIFGADTLDGRSNAGNHEIPFETIAAIARGSSSSSEVTLSNGDRLTLRGSNDVNDDNRGIAVGDPGIGQVTVQWDDFAEVRFTTPPTEPLARFDGGGRLHGTAYALDGASYTGWIRWDNDEEYGWEHLDGESGGLEYDIDFGLIQSIERMTNQSARVTLRDGRVVELSGSTDVSGDNRGIFITLDGGSVVLVEWEELERVTFDVSGTVVPTP